jgi:hypothetical protein
MSEWSGTTEDVDRYDGQEPVNRVVIEGVFKLPDTKED